MSIFSATSAVGAGAFDVVYSADELNPDVFADAGSPVTGRLFKILIREDVVLGSVLIFAAVDLSSFPAGSSFEIHGQGVGNSRGRIQGEGGFGGDGAALVGPNGGLGGGGGGAGTNTGAGGLGGAGAGQDGADGTGEAGGLGGQPGGSPGGAAAGSNGGPGGTALDTGGYPTTLIDVAVWGGGGGGAGGATAATRVGASGGDPGEDGGDSGTTLFGGTAGNAIEHGGSVPTQVGGTDVRGPIVS